MAGVPGLQRHHQSSGNFGPVWSARHLGCQEGYPKRKNPLREVRPERWILGGSSAPRFKKLLNDAPPSNGETDEMRSASLWLHRLAEGVLLGDGSYGTDVQRKDGRQGDAYMVLRGRLFAGGRHGGAGTRSGPDPRADLRGDGFRIRSPQTAGALSLYRILGLAHRQHGRLLLHRSLGEAPGRHAGAH